MLGYFVLFVIVGFIISKVIESDKTIFIIFIILSGGWALSFGPVWGLVTFGELAGGYVLHKFLS